MFLIQLLLPSPGDGAAADPQLAETRGELIATFGGVTAYLRAPAHGDWTSSGGFREGDTVVMVEVVTERFDRAWWRTYARTLAARFEQEVIHIRATTVELVDDDAR